LSLINFAEESGNGNKFINGMKMDIDRHGPRLMANNCQHPDPPYFSLPSTLKIQHQSVFHNSQLLFFATNWPQTIKVTDLKKLFARQDYLSFTHTVKIPILKSSLMRQIAPLEYISTLIKRPIPKKPR
jgi:hypothetical protein